MLRDSQKILNRGMVDGPWSIAYANVNDTGAYLEHCQLWSLVYEPYPSLSKVFYINPWRLIKLNAMEFNLLWYMGL